jgi:hypothetical protein
MLLCQRPAERTATTNKFVRLEVGIAHRCNVDETRLLNNRFAIVYLNRFTHDAPVGGAHL